MTRAAMWTAAFYAAMFAALGAHLPFWPLWLEDWGLTPAEVGLYSSIGVAIRVVAGFAIPVLADMLDSRRRVMSLLSASGILIFAAHAVIDQKSVLLLATVAAGVVIAGLLPLGETLGSAAANRHGFAYAPVRAMGSVGFLITSFLVGFLIGRSSSDAALWYLVICLAITAVLAEVHPGGGALKGTKPPAPGNILRLLLNPTFALFVLAASLLQSSHAVFYAYGSLHWRALGLSEPKIGMLWAFGVIVEIGLMLWLGRRVVERLGAVFVLALASGAALIRWGLMATDPSGLLLWALQATHALTFALGHLGAIAFIAAAVPDRLGGSAQGGYSGFAGGLLTAIAMGLAAFYYPEFGGQTYLIAAAMAFVSLLLTAWLARKWDGGMLSDL